jgi:hypothetical protein
MGKMSKYTATHMANIITAFERAKEQLRVTNSIDGIQNALIDMSVAFIDGLARVVEAEGGDADHIQPNEIIRSEIQDAFISMLTPNAGESGTDKQHSTLNYEQQGIVARCYR